MITMTLLCLTFFLFTLTLFGFMNGDGLREDLVFEAFSYGPSTAYSLYMGKEASPGNRTAKEHFKHPLVDMWTKDIVVHKVTLATIKDSKVDAYVVFDGYESDKTSWMSQNRILNSSYTDIQTSPANYFSVEGWNWVSMRRAFYMNKVLGRCQQDAGWIQMLSGVGYCDYEKVPGYSSLTLISYSPTSKFGLWSESAIADSMKIYIEYTEIGKQESTVALASTEPAAAIMLTDAAIPTTANAQETTPLTLETSPTTENPLQSAKTVKGMSLELLAEIPLTVENPIVSSPQLGFQTDAESSTILFGEKHNNCSECCVYQRSFYSEENLTIVELKEIVQLLKLQLQVNKTNLSSFIRRRTSAKDKRPSVTVIGSVIGATTAAIVFGVIVVPDLVTLGGYLWKKLN